MPKTPQDKRILGDIRLAFELSGICGEGKRISAEALLTYSKSVDLNFNYVDLLNKHQTFLKNVIAYSKDDANIIYGCHQADFFGYPQGQILEGTERIQNPGETISS
jgi:hypothetical protein